MNTPLEMDINKTTSLYLRFKEKLEELEDMDSNQHAFSS